MPKVPKQVCNIFVISLEGVMNILIFVMYVDLLAME